MLRAAKVGVAMTEREASAVCRSMVGRMIEAIVCVCLLSIEVGFIDGCCVPGWNWLAYFPVRFVEFSG